jgi:hypothetical protein
MPQVTAPKRSAIQPAGFLFQKQNPSEAHMGMVMVKCPQTGRAIPTGIRPIARVLGAARCFSGTPVARSATPITPGSHGKPGSTSRAPGRGVVARAPWPDHPHGSSTIVMGDTMAHTRISAEAIYDSAQRIRSELLELVRFRGKVRGAEARQKARNFGPREKPIKARTYLDGTQLRSGPCWKC